METMDTGTSGELRRTIESLFDHEPVAVGTALSMAVTGTLTYLSFFGLIEDRTIGAITGLLTLWLPVAGLLLRSQYTPFAHREPQGSCPAEPTEGAPLLRLMSR